MKQLMLILILFLTAFFNIIAQENIFGKENEFPLNEIRYVFGDNVKLREASDVNSKVISLLKIDAEITVLEKTNDFLFYNGINSYWYKVTYKNSIGFILGGLISLDKKEVDNSKYLLSLKKENSAYYILVRVVNEDKPYLENSSLLGVEQGFSMKTFDNQGVVSIENMVYIDFMVESCGFNGGGYYLFNDGNTLKKAIELTQIGDGGNWFGEELIFPTNKNGKEGVILYEKEIGEVLDEQTNHTKIIIEKKELIWKGKTFIQTKD
ncbi:SH3 domain-containing protein [Tenacibaculum finnmarkense]|uniref:SH3 domain-containing protein n=1 Tax=Tenacibaculum finnmarkense TaxID=2781243 RepID=UPI001EFBC1B7|nr:SH3 domain-containing protein [Tenacibaculum finnmarkense]MCG8805368.1 SH3 domain-containing protein [Tenacibaculum finnmarkense]MCG8856647.1 SH3 domain-containing protein [Tenacibaculum finnmarkense]